MFVMMSSLWLIVLVGLSITLGFIAGVATSIKTKKFFQRKSI